MTRMRIAREGSWTHDGRLIATRALEWPDRVTVTAPASPRSYYGPDIVGEATNIRREFAGWITADVEGAPPKLSPMINITTPLDSDIKTDSGGLVLLKGRLHSIHFGDTPVWDGLGPYDDDE